MQVTLGGERLGAGKKMKVELHNYERSTHDLGRIWRSTMSAGTLVPFLSEVALPGDTFDIELDCDIKTHPTVGPLFGSYKVQLDLFMAPVRLYQGQLHNNKLGIGMKMSDIKLPTFAMAALTKDYAAIEDIDNAQINPSSLLAYLGLRGIGIPDGSNRLRNFNGIPILVYWDIYKNYYANKQEEIGAVIHTGFTGLVETVEDITINGNLIPQLPTTGTTVILAGETISVGYTVPGDSPLPEQIQFNINPGGRILLSELADNLIDDGAGTITGTVKTLYDGINVIAWGYITPSQPIPLPPNIVTFPLSNLDDMREKILTATQVGTAFVINDANLNPYELFLGSTAGFNHSLFSQEGLGLKTYQSDLFNNWLSTEWIDGSGGINEITAIDTSGGSFEINQLLLGRKVYDMLNRIAISGGTYDDWLDAVYTHERYTRCETPMYMGGLSKELIFQEVVSNSASEVTQQGDQPLGTLAGKGVMANKHKGGKATIKVDEISYIMGIVSITPRVDYSQGNKWDIHLATMDDFHKPALDEIGFQELITEQMHWASTEYTGGAWVTKSAGKQPAWINYMTAVNECRGNFAIKSNEMFMTLNRRYEMDMTTNDIKDLTTYIDPVKFNNIFATTTIDSQNFWTQIAVDITARRKMSAKVIPNL